MEWTNAIGRRKAAVARVFLSPGKGDIIINDKPIDSYFTVNHMKLKVVEPLKIVNGTGQYNITVNVDGGGIKGQAEAVMLGISRALIKFDANFKPALKAQGLLTRDSRIVERKKPGLRKARKRSQYSKR